MAMPGVPLDGHLLQSAREARRLSTSQLAHQLGCSPGHLRLLERGIRHPSIELLGRIEDALGVPAAALGANVPIRRT